MIADFFVEHPILENSKFHNSVTNEVAQANLVDKEETWQLLFDGMTRRTAPGVGVVLISPHEHVIPRGYSLIKLCTNNIAEYNALIVGIQITWKLGLKHLEV